MMNNYCGAAYKRKQQYNFILYKTHKQFHVYVITKTHT